MSFADRQQNHSSKLPLAGLVEITFSVRQSSFSFRAGVLPLWFFGILFAGKQHCIILQRSARAGLPSVQNLHLFFISPTVATWPKIVGEYREENECVAQALGLCSEVLRLNPNCVA